jgi:hypothetical protein
MHIFTVTTASVKRLSTLAHILRPLADLQQLCPRNGFKIVTLSPFEESSARCCLVAAAAG